LASLKALNAFYFAETAASFPRPYSDYPSLHPSVILFDLPSILVPPEVIELDGLSTDSSEDSQVKKEEWPEYFFRLFDNDARLLLHQQLAILADTLD
jgi:nuclear cap-binding protein subunit 1